MISVVIPLYDKATQVRDTLTAVRKQTFTAYEVIIVDDGSTDGSPDVVREYLREYGDFARQVRLLDQPHAGVSVARNKAIAESRFDWIAFLDADDTWEPGYLQAQYNLLSKYPFCDVLGAAYGLNQGGGKVVRAKLSTLPFEGTDGVLDNYFKVAINSHPPLTTSATIARKSAIQEVGGFPENVSSGEDLLTWARLAINGRIAFNTKCMVMHNRDPHRFNRDQLTRMPSKDDVVGGSLEGLFRQHAGIPGLKAYIGAWHKMRARIYLSNSMKKEAWTEWRKLVRFHPVHYKTWAYLLVLICPVKVI